MTPDCQGWIPLLRRDSARVVGGKLVLWLLLTLLTPSVAWAQAPIVGVIRFDVWPSNGSYADTAVRQLDPNQWHYRIPFFGSETGFNSVTMNESTQAVIDQELAMSVNSGITFWCFDHQISIMHSGIDLYRSSTSPNKPLVKVCTIEGNLFQARIDDTINFMNAERANWLYVSGRPFFLLLNDQGLLDAAGVTLLRNNVMANGFANPYLVCMHDSVGQAVADAAAFGCDAISSYVMGAPRGGSTSGLPYSDLMTKTEADWTSYASQGIPMVPTVMPGWDQRPVGTNYYGGAVWTNATPSEFATHLQHAVDFVRANPTTNPTRMIVISAWNEIGEGHYIVPMNPATNPIGTGLIDAIGSVLRSRQTPSSPSTVRVQ